MSRIAGDILGALLTFTPLGADAADLVVWWDEGYYAEEGDAIAEITAAFEQASGNQVELTTFWKEREAISGGIAAGFVRSQPPADGTPPSGPSRPAFRE